jgi:hypothetical protein
MPGPGIARLRSASSALIRLQGHLRRAWGRSQWPCQVGKTAATWLWNCCSTGEAGRQLQIRIRIAPARRAGSGHQRRRPPSGRVQALFRAARKQPARPCRASFPPRRRHQALERIPGEEHIHLRGATPPLPLSPAERIRETFGDIVLIEKRRADAIGKSRPQVHARRIGLQPNALGEAIRAAAGRCYLLTAR